MQSPSAIQSGVTFDQAADPATVRACQELWHSFRDPLAFIPNALKVQNRQGKLVPFHLKNKQIELAQRVEAKRAEGGPIRFIIPKTRRVGMSAEIAALIFHQTPFFEGQSALILAHEKSAARNLFNYYHRFEHHYTPFKGIGLPRILGRTASQGEGSIRWVNRSQIEIATAKNLDFSRSFDFRFLHLSEFAYYPHIRGLMTALVATVADDPGTMIFKESTANGYNEFYSDCIAAQDGSSDYELFFVGCFDDEENWRELDRDRIDPIKFEESLTDDEFMLRERYDLALEQLYWRRMKLKDYSDDLKRFDQEFPHSFEVAFISSGRQRFDPALFLGMPTDIPSKRGELRKELRNRTDAYYFASHTFGELTVWKDFKKSGQYVGGCDPAKGVDINEGVGTPDPDWCAAEIGERETGEQTMELHTRVPPVTLAQYLYDLGAWCFQETGQWIYWVVEVGFDGGNGLAVLTELVRLGYPLEYIYFNEVLDEATTRRKKEMGFVIRPNTRPLLISVHESMLINKSLILHSRHAIAEHRTFVYKKRASGGVKIEHEDGCHDDLVFACMYLSWAMSHAPVFRRPNAAKIVRYAVGGGVVKDERSRAEEEIRRKRERMERM